MPYGRKQCLPRFTSGTTHQMSSLHKTLAKMHLSLSNSCERLDGRGRLHEMLLRDRAQWRAVMAASRWVRGPAYNAYPRIWILQDLDLEVNCCTEAACIRFSIHFTIRSRFRELEVLLLYNLIPVRALTNSKISYYYI